MVGSCNWEMEIDSVLVGTSQLGVQMHMFLASVLLVTFCDNSLKQREIALYLWQMSSGKSSLGSEIY